MFVGFLVNRRKPSSPFDCSDRLGLVAVDQSKHPNMTKVDIQISSPLISVRLWQDGRADEWEGKAVEAGTLKSSGSSSLQQSQSGGGGHLITLSGPPHTVTAEAGQQPDGEGWRASAQITAITEWTSHWWEPPETKTNDSKINQILTTQQIVSHVFCLKTPPTKPHLHATLWDCFSCTPLRFRHSKMWQRLT